MLHAGSCEQATLQSLPPFCLQNGGDSLIAVGLELVKLQITGILEFEHEKPDGTFQPGKRDYLLSVFTFPGYFVVVKFSIHTPNRNIRNFGPNGKRPIVSLC